MPNVADLLDEKVKFEHDARRIDRTHAILNSAVALVLPQNAPKRQERATVLWRCITKVGDDSLDIVVPVASALANAGLHALKESGPVLSKINHILNAAGYQGKR